MSDPTPHSHGSVGEQEAAFVPLDGDDLERIDVVGGCDEEEFYRLVQTAEHYRQGWMEGRLARDVLSEMLASLDRTSYCGMADKAREWLRNGIPSADRRVTRDGSTPQGGEEG